jgi:hypothetical protein
VRAFWSFSSLDEHGMGVNFRDLKDVLRREVHDRYDPRHLNDIAPFDRVPPTADESCARGIRCAAGASTPGPRGRLVRVEVWEGPEACAAYEE